VCGKVTVQDQARPADRPRGRVITSPTGSHDSAFIMARPSPEHIQLVEGRPPPAYSEEDDGDVSSDEGNQDEEALLGSENRTRGRERYLQNVSSNVTKLWPQIKDIVLEVRLLSLQMLL